TCVLVPAALDRLAAGPQQVSQLTAPAISKMQLGDATIDVKADHSLVAAGGKVKVTLTASAPTAKKGTVELIVLESTGADGGRIEAPPNKVEWQAVTLDAKPGGSTKEIAFRLAGNVGSSIGGNDRYGQYTILVMEPKQATALANALRKEKR